MKCQNKPTAELFPVYENPLTVTEHLRLMEQAGIVRSTRRGRESVWQLERRRLEDARRYLSLISTQWDKALERLRAFVED